jgi:hypothetical protein
MSPTPIRRSFEVILKGGKKGELAGWIEVPFSVEELFGTRGRVPVKVTVNGLTYRSSMSNMGGGCHIIPVRRDRAEKANARAGEKVSVTIEHDTAKRTVTPPKELKALLAKNAKAKAGWDAFSFTHKREWAEAIRDAKRPETKQKRLAQAIAALEEKAQKRR